MGNTATSNIGATTYKAKTTIGDYDYYLYEHADDLGNASVYTLRVPKGEDLSKRNTKVDGVTYGFEQYVVTTGALSETYLQSNGNLAYTSSFHDGYFSNGAVSGILLGELSTFVTTGAQASAASGGEEHVKYSIQIVYSNDLERWMKGTNGSGIAMFGPPRGTIDNINSTNKNLKVTIYPNRGTITSGFNTVYLDVTGEAITDFTFAYDSTYTSFATADSKGVDTKGTMDMDIFVNGKLINGINIASGSNVVYYDDSVADQNKTLSVNLDQTNKTTDTNYKFGENGATNIYAIRFYGKTLTTAEIRQNHFADVVKRNKVDVSNFFSLKESQKQEMYNLFADVLLDEKTTAELQAMYDKKYEDLIWTDIMEEGNESHNHVIELARYYSLDLTLYNSLTAQVKEALYVYTNKQTLDESIFDMDMAVMFEAWIYEALKFVASGGETAPEITALDLFVKEGLQYHISFLKAEGTGGLVTKEIMANYVLFNAEGNTVYLAPYSSKAANAPYLMDGYLKLYNESDSTYHGAQLNDMTAINASQYYTQEQVIKVAKTGATSTQMWLQPFMRVTAKSATGVSSVTMSRWGRQGWAPFPMVYTTLSVKTNSLNLIPQTSDFKVTDAQTYTFVYERDFTKTTYVYNSEDYGETNKVVNEYDKDDNNKGIKKGDHVATYTDTYYANYKSGSTKLPVTLPALTPERIAAIKEAGWVVKDAEGNVTDYLRSNTSDFEGATIIMTGTMAVTGYINANKAYTLAEQPYTNSTGVTNIGADSNASYLNFYALRVYNRALSQPEIAQNHFADLAYKFDFELDIFALLSEDQRKEVYEAMKSYHVSDEKADVVDAYTDALRDLYYSSEEETPTENELHFYEVAMYYKLNLTQFNKLGRDSQLAIYDEFAEVVAGEMSALEIALLLQKAIDYQLGEYFARDLITFEGYQARLTQFAGIRATFNYDSEKLAELEADGCSVEFGVIMAIASEGRTAKDLTLKKSDGAYVATGKQMLASAVYKNGVATGSIIENEDDEARPRFVYSIIYEKESSKTAQMYALDCIYRAYVVVTKDGNDYITYFDCESERFGESISAYELSTCWFYDENLDNDIFREVIDTVGYTEEAIALYTQYAETVEKIEKEGIMSLLFDELNFLYNIQLKADKNNTLKLNLKYYEESGKTSEVDGNTDVYGGIDALINAYNAFHGVDVRDDLYEITGESEIVYFDVSTDKDPHTYTMGDSITFNVNIRDKDSDQLISADKISYTYKIDGVSGSKTDTASAPAGKFSVTIPASEISASSLAGKGIVVNLVGTIEDLTHEKLVAGAVVDYDKITNSAEKPADYDTFWQETLNAIKSVSPTDTTVTPYTGDGVVISDIKRTEDANGHATYSTESGRTISEDNYFHLVPVDEERLAYLKSKGYNETISADRLTTHYIYEVYLKSPGPNPSVGVITMPKNPTASTKIILSFAGYSASSPSISLWDNNIRFNVSHNGYWVDASKVELYDKLNTSGILGSYGKVNSKPNSTYTNKSDNYILYLFLRNLQALRFVTELPVSTDGIEDVHLKTVYDTLIKAKSLGGGAITLSGSSMGGFQSLSLAGMAEMYGIQIADVIATVPAFCNPSSATIDGRIDDGFGIGYEENMRYFDPAFFASYIDVTNEVYIDRCGLGDYTCPPSGIIAAYNAIKSQKKIVFYQNSDHGYKIDEAIYKFTVSHAKAN